MNNSIQLDLSSNKISIKANERFAERFVIVVFVCLISLTIAVIARILR